MRVGHIILLALVFLTLVNYINCQNRATTKRPNAVKSGNNQKKPNAQAGKQQAGRQQAGKQQAGKQQGGKQQAGKKQPVKQQTGNKKGGNKSGNKGNQPVPQTRNLPRVNQDPRARSMPIPDGIIDTPGSVERVQYSPMPMTAVYDDQIADIADEPSTSYYPDIMEDDSFNQPSSEGGASSVDSTTMKTKTKKGKYKSRQRQDQKESFEEEYEYTKSRNY